MATRNRAGITRQALIEASLRLLDEVGLDGLTVRRLASELGVQSPALYWHLRTKQELLDGMADAIIVAAGMGPPRRGESWQQWLARRARAYRRSLLAHRDGARVVVGARRLSPSTVGLFAEELSAMVGCGFSPALALRTISTISQYINGFVLQEQTYLQAAAEPETTAVTELPQVMRAALEAAVSPIGEETFEHGLRTLIDGTASALARETPTERPLMFLDVDGPLIPYGGTPPRHEDQNQEQDDSASHPMLGRLRPEHGRRLAQLPCDLVWATAWGDDANEMVAPRLGLPELPVVTWPADKLADEPAANELDDDRVHWKTRSLVAWASGRDFVWIDDEMTDADRAWVAAHHTGQALLHQVDPRRGLTDADFDVIARWLARR
jgi:TetR/AcrR family tetracycline transcriptional repressor